MLNETRDEARAEYLRRRRFRHMAETARDKAEDFEDIAEVRAGQLIGRFTHEGREHPQPKVTYVIPVRGRLLSNFRYPETFTHMPNPLKLDLHDLFREFLRSKDEGTIFDASKSTDVAFDTAHARDLARKAIAETEENVIRTPGLEALMSEVMKRAGPEGVRGAFSHVEIGEEKIPLFQENGLPTLLNKIFPGGKRSNRKPLPDGTVLRFVSSDKVIKATVLTTPDAIKLPYLCLIGSQKIEDGNLSDIMNDARKNGKRIVVVYKEGDDGLIDSFIQSKDDSSDVYEVTDRDRVTKINGKPANDYILPNPVKGKLQIVTTPVQGGIEDYVMGKAQLPEAIGNTKNMVKAVFGIDPVQTGTSVMKAKAMPIDYHGLMGRVFRPVHLRRLFRKDKEKFFRYIQVASIMPVHLVAVETEKIVVKKSPKSKSLTVSSS